MTAVVWLPVVEEKRRTTAPKKFAESRNGCGSYARKKMRSYSRITISCAEVQEVADAVADSLNIIAGCRQKRTADVIAFGSVHFMAETAAICCPNKIVLLPDLRAGCSLAASITRGRS